jgi:ribosomal protein S18 acetylase RimI-like enzyme
LRNRGLFVYLSKYLKFTLSLSMLTFRPLSKQENIPYDLLLLADPAKDVIDTYLKTSFIFVAEKSGILVGVLVLLPVSDLIIEIKNVAVLPELQGQGVGTFLIEKSIEYAKINEFENIIIGTANSSIGQLYLYQKLGFVKSEIKKIFFLENYTDPIYENGIQAVDMIILKMRV